MFTFKYFIHSSHFILSIRNNPVKIFCCFLKLIKYEMCLFLFILFFSIRFSILRQKMSQMVYLLLVSLSIFQIFLCAPTSSRFNQFLQVSSFEDDFEFRKKAFEMKSAKIREQTSNLPKGKSKKFFNFDFKLIFKYIFLK